MLDQDWGIFAQIQSFCDRGTISVVLESGQTSNFGNTDIRKLEQHELPSIQNVHCVSRCLLSVVTCFHSTLGCDFGFFFLVVAVENGAKIFAQGGGTKTIDSIKFCPMNSNC